MKADAAAEVWPPLVAAPALVPPCGQGTWKPGGLEIHHINVGQADSTLIVGPSGQAILVDAGETQWTYNRGALKIGQYVERVLGCRKLAAVVVTHFHLDHVGYVGRGGFWHLAMEQGFQIGTFFHRDFARFVGDTSGTLLRWREWLDGAGRERVHPAVLTKGSLPIDLGPGVELRILGVDGGGAIRAGDFSADRAPPNENDYSVVLGLRYGKLDYVLGGDLTGEHLASPFGYTYHDIETPMAREMRDVDVYRVSHHGSDHSSNPTWLAQIDPEVSIVSCGDGNSYGHPRPQTMERLLGTSAVFLTERGDPKTDIGQATVAGDVVLRSADGETYTVNGRVFVATDPLRIDQDGDGYFREADLDDSGASTVPLPRGGCDQRYQECRGL